MFIPILLAQAVSTADYACWMENANGQVVDMSHLCQPEGVTVDAEIAAPPSPPSSPQPEAAATAPGDGFLLEQSGSLAASDEVGIDGSFIDRYSFRGVAGQPVSIRLESDEFDTYLVLMDASEQVIAVNDDAEFLSTNSRIDTTLPADGTYQVVVNSFWSGEQGSYNLTVQGGATQ